MTDIEKKIISIVSAFAVGCILGAAASLVAIRDPDTPQQVTFVLMLRLFWTALFGFLFAWVTYRFFVEKWWDKFIASLHPEPPPKKHTEISETAERIAEEVRDKTIRH